MHFENVIGTRNARIVLIDDPHRLRATVTAFWLTQLNQAEIYILDDTLTPAALAPAPAPETAAASGTATPITAAALLRLYREHAADIVDVSPSIDFERAHIPGARFLLPASLTPLTAIIPAPRQLVSLPPTVSPRNSRPKMPLRAGRNRQFPGCRTAIKAGSKAASHCRRIMRTRIC